MKRLLLVLAICFGLRSVALADPMIGGTSAIPDTVSFGQTHIVQISSTSCIYASTATTTASLQWALTNLTNTMTPLFSGDTIYINVSGIIQGSNGVTAAAFYSLFRGTTNLNPNSLNGFGEVDIGSAVSYVDSFAITNWPDNPNTVSPVTYTLAMGTSASATTTISPNSNPTCMSLWEGH